MNLSTTHAASSYGLPVLVDGAGRAYGFDDLIDGQPAGPEYYRAYRALLGLTQEGLARALDCSTSTIQNKECGRHATTRADLLALEALRMKAGKEID